MLANQKGSSGPEVPEPRGIEQVDPSPEAWTENKSEMTQLRRIGRRVIIRRICFEIEDGFSL